MDQQLKQRLIGVTVLVALVVIFVPMLFDKAGERSSGAPEGIPPIPEDVVETKPIELPKSAEDMEEKDKDAIPESGYKIIPLTDEPQPAAKARGAATPAEGEGEEAAVGEDDGAGEEAAASAEPLDGDEAVPTPRPVRLEKLESPAVKDARKAKPAATPAPQKSSTAKEKTAAVKPPAKPTGEKSAPAPSWVVQTGSFAVEAKASALVEKLRQSKYPAYMEKVQGASGTLFRVKVGPELDRGRAEQMQKQIEASTGLKGIIVPHR